MGMSNCCGDNKCKECRATEKMLRNIISGLDNVSLPTSKTQRRKIRNRLKKKKNNPLTESR